MKPKQCEEATNQLGQDEVALSQFKGHVICEPPNSILSRFEGTMEWEGRKYAIDNDQILLRGAVLRNTDWCYGLVIFAGKDTKLMQNSGKAKFKRTSIDRLLNFIILGIVFFLLCMCLFCTIACGVWETLTGQKFQVPLQMQFFLRAHNTTWEHHLRTKKSFIHSVFLLNFLSLDLLAMGSAGS